jgi:3-dehydroquinate synthase
MQPIQANVYNIFFNEIGYTSLNNFLENNNYSKIYILADSNSSEFCLPTILPMITTNLQIEIIEIENGEINKTIETCVQIWNALIELGADRKSILINIGGGVITDIGGFIAATFKRGIDFINIPTTLLSMVDASIGGKNGVDLGNLKNQIGTITVPKMVLIDSDFLQTLPQNQIRSGLAEMLKHGLIFNKNYWNRFVIQINEESSKIDFADFDDLIYESIKIKNEIVSQDLTENGIRKSLNFGHTLGHAIESFFLENETKTTLLHGEAIAVGMILESHISLQKKLISLTEYNEIKNTINNIFDFILFNETDIKTIKELLIHDKKNEYGTIQFALLNKIGHCIYNEIVDNQMIDCAFEDYKKK